MIQTKIKFWKNKKNFQKLFEKILLKTSTFDQPIGRETKKMLLIRYLSHLASTSLRLGSNSASPSFQGSTPQVGSTHLHLFCWRMTNDEWFLPFRSTGILPKRVIRFDPIRGLWGQSETIVRSGQHMKEKNEKLLDFGIFWQFLAPKN